MAIAARRLRVDVQQYCSRTGQHIIESKEGAAIAVWRRGILFRGP